MNRNQIIIAVGVVVIGAIAYAGYKIAQKRKEEKAEKQVN
jgi:hypothetical protein